MEIRLYSSPDDEDRLMKMIEDEGEEWTCYSANPFSEQYRAALRSSLTYVAYEGDTLCGYSRSIGDCGFYIYVCDLLVKPKHRGKNIGRQLIKRVCADYPEHKVYVMSDVDEYYLKQGYRREGSIFEVTSRIAADWTVRAVRRCVRGQGAAGEQTCGDKQLFRTIRDSGFGLPEGRTPVDLLPDLMQGLGDLDPELRDHLCLEILWTWIDAGYYTPDELRQVACRLKANLREGIGELEGDRVFLRTFSVLILGAIVTYDARVRFLEPEELREILAEGLWYLANEQDLRGFVPDKGWAHSVAHTADLMRALALHPTLSADDHEQILKAIVQKVIAPAAHPYLENEDGRLGGAVLAILRRELLPLDRVTACLEILKGTGARHKNFVPGRDSATYHNARCFVRCLHLLLAHPDLPAQVRERLPGVVYEAMKSFAPWGL